MKKAIVFMPKLSIGGMEKAFVNFIKFSNLTRKYDVDIILGYCENKLFLEELQSLNVNVNLICKGKWNIFSKATSYIKLKLLGLKIKNNYDLSICYSHHHKILANLSRAACKNNACFIHTDLINSRTPDELHKLLNNLKFDSFSNIVCVSEHVKNTFCQLYPNYSGNVVVANNYIDGEYIINESKKEVNDFKFTRKTFINLSRHEDAHKKISYIIKSSKKLIDEGYNFDVLLLGDGEDHSYYVKLVDSYGIRDSIHFIGNKTNPYKYLKNSDAIIVSSAFEGYGIVLDEARLLNIPIITTDVADAKKIVNEGYGLLADHSEKGLYEKMKLFLDKGYKIKKEFDYKKFNSKITKELDKIFDGGNI